MKNSVHERALGFTLIELMVVVAIVGILGAIAIPQYRDYLTRSRWQDTYSAALPVKAAIAECAHNNNGAFAAAPCDTLANLIGANFLPAGTTGVGKFGATVAVAGGVITMDGSAVNNLGNCVVTLTPAGGGGGAALTWTLGSVTANCGRDRIGAST